MITIFHEPINVRAENIARIGAAAKEQGVKLKTDVFATRETWRQYALDALHKVERIAVELGVQDRLHSWPDSSLGSKSAIKSQPNPKAYCAWLNQRRSRISEWPTQTPSTPASVTAAAFTPRYLFPPEDCPPKNDATAPPSSPPPVSADQQGGASTAQLSTPGPVVDNNIKSILVNEPAGAATWEANLQHADIVTLKAVLAELPATAGIVKRDKLEQQLHRRIRDQENFEEEVFKDFNRESIKNDIITRLRANGSKINVRMTKSSCPWDYRSRIRGWRKSRGFRMIFTTKRGAGMSLDEVAKDHNYSSIDELLDDLERAADMHSMSPEDRQYVGSSLSVGPVDIPALAAPLQSYLWGNVESVESPSNNSTIPPVPHGDRTPVDSGAITPASLPADASVIVQNTAIPAPANGDRLRSPISTIATVVGYYPPHSLVDRFVSYCCHQIESARIFMAAGALTLLSIMAGRRIFYKWGDQTIYPNLMHVLLAPSGARKTQLISIVTAFANELCPCALLADTTSHERLVESLAEESTRAMIYPEGKTLIDLVNRSPELTTDFIKLADCEQVSTEFKSNRHTMVDGKASCRIVAADPFLTVLIGIVSQGMNINEKTLTNGFLGRFLLLMAEGTERDIVSAPPVMTEIRVQLSEDFRRIADLAGEMHLTTEAATAFTAIQLDNRDRLRANPSEAIASNLNRMPFFMLRVAMLFQLATDGQLAISESVLRFAQQYVELQHRHYREFVALYAVDKASRLQKRILITLERYGPDMTHSRLFNRVSTHGECNATTFRAALKVLKEAEKIRFVPNPEAHFPDVVLVEQSPERSPGNPIIHSGFVGTSVDICSDARDNKLQ